MHSWGARPREFVCTAYTSRESPNCLCSQGRGVGFLAWSRQPRKDPGFQYYISSKRKGGLLAQCGEPQEIYPCGVQAVLCVVWESAAHRPCSLLLARSWTALLQLNVHFDV